MNITLEVCFGAKEQSNKFGDDPDYDPATGSRLRSGWYGLVLFCGRLNYDVIVSQLLCTITRPTQL